MRLYHGSNIAIDKIDLTKSKTNKDFGFGFYLSKNKEQARDMANFKAVILGGEPIITTFDIDDNVFRNNNLKIKSFYGYSLEWAEFILLNRKNYSRIQAHDYDIVIGPIADDKVGPQVRRLEEGEIDINEFLSRIKYIKRPTIQYFFGTEKSIAFLNRIV